jgi:phosphate transport system protein
MPTRETFDRDLHQLQDDFLRMGALVESAIRQSLEVLRSLDVAAADSVIAEDDRINALPLDLEERCLELIVRQQPMASDMRTIAAVLTMSIDLERMGDHAKDIGRITRRIVEEPLLKPLIDVPRMGEIVREMLRDGLHAFVRRDADLAARMASRDDDVDHLYAQVFRELLTYMLEDPKNIQRATHLLMVAQALERIGDHATNLAERVIYMVTGTLRELNT